MPSVVACSCPREVMRKVDEDGAGDVSAEVLPSAPVFILEVVSAVGNQPGRVGELGRERFGRDERRMRRHVRSLSSVVALALHG